jgi:hypothetical protein
VIASLLIALKAPTREARASALSESNAKFAGRRKPGGGYTYLRIITR